jgi:hypothetical protein
MIRLDVFTNEIGPDGELVDHRAATCEVCGHQLTMIDGGAEFIPIGMPVFSERYCAMIDFDTDGEEWARNLPRAYRSGAATVIVAEVSETATSAASEREPARAYQTR